jgi:hypothetical protein
VLVLNRVLMFVQDIQHNKTKVVYIIMDLWQALGDVVREN